MGLGAGFGAGLREAGPGVEVGLVWRIGAEIRFAAGPPHETVKTPARALASTTGTILFNRDSPGRFFRIEIARKSLHYPPSC